MKTATFIYVFLLVGCSSATSFGQHNGDTSKISSGEICVFIKNDDRRIVGKVLNQDKKGIMINTRQSGIIVIHRDEIREVRIATKEDEASLDNAPGTFTYGEVGGGYGTHGIFKMAINTLNDNNKIITVCFYFNSHRDPASPSDYSPGIFETDIP